MAGKPVVPLRRSNGQVHFNHHVPPPCPRHFALHGVGRHGGRGKNRLEARVVDLAQPARWQFKDLNGDGHTDFRYYKGDGQDDFWWAEVWQVKAKRFMFGKEFAGKK